MVSIYVTGKVNCLIFVSDPGKDNFPTKEGRAWKMRATAGS